MWSAAVTNMSHSQPAHSTPPGFPSNAEVAPGKYDVRYECGTGSGGRRVWGGEILMREARYKPGDRVWVGQSRSSMREALVLHPLGSGSYKVDVIGRGTTIVDGALLSDRGVASTGLYASLRRVPS